jgi:hypothetical protein
MDRPHHPLVIRPWKTRQTQQQKCGAPPFKAAEARFDPKGPKPFSTGKETRKNPKRSG